MKYNINVLDCKFSERELDEIFADGGNPCPQDGVIRFDKTKLTQEIQEKYQKKGYRMREYISSVEFVR